MPSHPKPITLIPIRHPHHPPPHPALLHPQPAPAADASQPQIKHTSPPPPLVSASAFVARRIRRGAGGVDMRDSRAGDMSVRLLGGAAWRETALAGAVFWTANAVAKDGGQT
ncbi:hypothetical protein V500_08734 [Pseudogymnoascus sp. VKM F-4518 (FW-2643)]|nr:hypothetical protein V500_08734 [Pseudogymnoascus sp. VKM F-4518 (FW-2643)]